RLKEADQLWVAGRQAAGQNHAVLQTESVNLTFDRLTVCVIGARAGQHQDRVRMSPKQFWRLPDQPALIFYRINPPDCQQQAFTPNEWKCFRGDFPMILSEKAGGHAMRLHDNSSLRVTHLEQRSFSLVADDDGIGARQQLS